MDNTTEYVDFETKQDNETCVNFDSLAIPESNSLSFGYDPQQILFGAIQFVIVTMFLLLHVPMMKNIYSRCDRTPATIGYKLIVFLAIVDEIQLVTHLYASIMMIFNLRTPVAPVLILGAFIDGAWFTTITLTFTITVFRFIVVAVDFLKYYFVTNIAFFVMTGINLCVFLAFFSLNISGLSREIFDFSEFGWWYAENCELSDFMMTIDLWGCSIFYCSSAVIYVLIFVYIFAKRKKNRNNQDIRSALQTFCFCLYTILVSNEWTFIYPYRPQPALYLFLQNLLWPIWNGVNVVFYFIFQWQEVKKTIKTDEKKTFQQRALSIPTVSMAAKRFSTISVQDQSITRIV